MSCSLSYNRDNLYLYGRSGFHSVFNKHIILFEIHKLLYEVGKKEHGGPTLERSELRRTKAAGLGAHTVNSRAGPTPPHNAHFCLLSTMPCWALQPHRHWNGSAKHRPHYCLSTY